MANYREGAKDRCYFCGKPRREHRGERLECPDTASRHRDSRDWEERRAGRRVPKKEPAP